MTLFKFKKNKFDPEGSGYDYESAHKYKIKPDKSGHYPSRVPQTGLILISLLFNIGNSILPCFLKR